MEKGLRFYFFFLHTLLKQHFALRGSQLLAIVPRTCSEGQRDRCELCVHAYLRADTRAYNARIYHADGIYRN